MDFEEILGRVGSFGRFQLLHFVACSVAITCSASHVLLSVFLAPTTNFRCADPQNGNGSSQQAPPGDWESEHTCSYPGMELGEAGNWTVNRNVSFDCTHFVYDTSTYSSTIVTRWDLVCEDAWLKAFATSVYMIGSLLGIFMFSFISDRIGRLGTVWIASIMLCSAELGVAFAPTYWVFLLFRLFSGASGLGVYTTSWVLAIEVVGIKHRTIVGMITCIFFGFGYMILALQAYFIRDYTWLTLSDTLCMGLPALLLCCFLSESPRWLLARGEVTKAEKVVRRMAKINRVKFPEDLFTDEKVAEAQKLRETSKSNTEKTYTWIDLFRRKNMCLMTFNISFCWLVHTVVYYGLVLGVTDLSGNPYVNSALSGVLEIPAYVIGMLIMDKIGRRVGMVVLLALSGVTCIAVPMVPSGWMATTMAMIGKMFITASFGVIYVYTAELYPTVVRTIGIGVGSTVSRLGSAAAPFVADLGNLVWKPLPQLIFGAMSLAAAALTLLLPETLNRRVPETMEDGEKAARMRLDCCPNSRRRHCSTEQMDPPPK